MSSFDRKLWSIPQWQQISVAIIVPLLVLGIGHLASPFIGDKVVLVALTIPITVCAFWGGLIGGVVSALTSLVASLYSLFVLSPSAERNRVEDSAWIIALAFVWAYLIYASNQQRRVAQKLEVLINERDFQRDRLITILDGIGDAFYAMDNNWILTHANSTFGHWNGKTREELIGQSVWDLLAAEQSAYVRDALRQSKESGKDFAMDMWVGELNMWFHARGFPDDLGMFVYIQDVTLRKELEARKEEMLRNEQAARQEAERISQLKDEFVAILSHELRTPLTAILGWSEILQSRVGDDPRVKDGLRAIDQSTRLQAQLIEELLDMSRISSGKIQIHPQVLNFGDVVKDCMAFTEASASSKRLILNCNIPDEAIYVKSDPVRIQQIVTNLISNAVKFTPFGGEITVSLGEEDAMAVFTVTDTGEGISAEFLPHVFDRFRQADASIRRSKGGLGLGLSIAEQLVKLHGGIIEASSQGLGKGSTFTVKLPLVPFYNDLAVRPVIPARRMRESLRGVQVLLVEDDGPTRDWLQIMLIENEASVTICNSAIQALAFLTHPSMTDEDLPNLIVSDLGMPEMDGFQFMQEVRKAASTQLRSVPSIALSAFAREEDKTRCAAAGYSMHLSKPIKSEELLDAIDQLGVQSPMVTH